MKFGKIASTNSFKEKKFFYISIIGAVWFMYSFITKGISSDGIVFNGLVGFICMLVMFFGERKRLKANSGTKSTSDVTIDQLVYTLSDKDDEDKRVLYFQNKSSYPIVDFCVEGISQSLKKGVGYCINSIVLPNKAVQNKIENSPDDIEIYKIKFTYLAENNSNVYVEYDLNLGSHKIDSEFQAKKPSRIRKWFNRLIVTWLVFSMLYAFTGTDTGADKKDEPVPFNPALNNTASADTSNEQSINNEPDVTLEDIEFNNDGNSCIYNIDSINNCWGEFRYVNNSKYTITKLQLTSMEKKTGEKFYVTFYDSVLPGESSPVDKTILAHDVDESFEPDLETLSLAYTYINDSGEYVHIYLDPKVGGYQYRKW